MSELRKQQIIVNNQNNAAHRTQVLVKRLRELVKSWWNLQPLLQNSPLPLYLNSLRELNESGQVPLRRQGTSNPKLLRPLLKQRVRHLLLLLLGCNWSFSASFRSLQMRTNRGKMRIKWEKKEGKRDKLVWDELIKQDGDIGDLIHGDNMKHADFLTRKPASSI